MAAFGVLLYIAVAVRAPPESDLSENTVLS